MLTTDDIRKLIDGLTAIFTTKEDLQKLDDKFYNKFQDVLTKLDGVYKEVKDMRQEQTIHVQQHEDTRDRLDKIESVPVIAHHISPS